MQGVLYLWWLRRTGRPLALLKITADRHNDIFDYKLGPMAPGRRPVGAVRPHRLDRRSVRLWRVAGPESNADGSPSAHVSGAADGVVV
jgi:hypothetical protein